MTVLIGNEVMQTNKKNTQVYKATHEGTRRMSLRDRSFVSFSYGGKSIEDFNLIAIINGDRMQRATYAQFEDITATYDVTDGQFYWGTHFLNNTLDLTLATDAITEQELNDFKNWFAPGKNQELILAEAPNRAILARIATSPVYSLLPFKQKTSIKIAGIDYETSTTAYRGEIKLSFTMDEPFWYARNNIINYWYTNNEDKFGSITAGPVKGRKATIDDKDFIKTITEDMIPHLSMLRTIVILGDGVYINENYSIDSLADFARVEYSKVGSEGYKTDSTRVSNIETAFLFYSGTAPSKPKVSFTLSPQIDNNYISYPLNSYSKMALNNQNINTYNQLAIGDSVFQFTAPDIFLGLNQAVTTVNLFKIGDSIEEIRTALRDAIKEYYSRAWAMFCIDVMIRNNWNVDVNSGAIMNDFHAKFYRLMSLFVKPTIYSNAYPAKFDFDFNTGEMVGRFEIRIANTSQAVKINSEDKILQLPFVFIEENVGNMIKSGHLIIKDRNFPDEDGLINIAQCTPVTTDYPFNCGGLRYLSINFKNLYL